MLLNQGDLILGEYEVTAPLHSDGIYQWAHAQRLNDDQSFLLQVLCPELPWQQSEISTILNYFDSVTGISRRSLHLPVQILSAKDYPLVVVYPPLSGEILENAPGAFVDNPANAWHEASEAINILHNRGLIHGGLNPQSLVMTGDGVVLTGFGYAPLAPEWLNKALNRHLAPETQAGLPLTKASDIFFFAQTVAHKHPELRTSSWYLQATHPDPDLRFRHLRDTAAGLERALALLNAQPSPARKSVTYEEEVPVLSSGPSIVPKYILSTVAEPFEGGRVQGGGRYRAGEQTVLSAVPAPGWQFEVWSEDLQSADNPVDLTVDANRTVVAHFSRFRTASWTLTAIAEPSIGGEVIGGGRHFDQTNVDVEAQPARGWQFMSWQGDLHGDIKKASVMMTGDRMVTALFRRMTDPVFSFEALPLEGGKVLGGGSHLLGENVVVRAVPNPLWRFSHWSGDSIVENRRNPVELLADCNRSLSAHFERTIWEEVNLNISVDPLASGKVTGGGKCQKGQVYSVLASPNKGWRFSHWSGDITGTGLSSPVLMDTDRTVKAHFVQAGQSLMPDKSQETASSLGSAFYVLSGNVQSVDVENASSSDDVKDTASSSLMPKWVRTSKDAAQDKTDAPEKQSSETPLPKRTLSKHSKPAIGKAFVIKPEDT